jgi:hypothetical protein
MTECVFVFYELCSDFHADYNSLLLVLVDEQFPLSNFEWLFFGGFWFVLEWLGAEVFLGFWEWLGSGFGDWIILNKFPWYLVEISFFGVPKVTFRTRKTGRWLKVWIIHTKLWNYGYVSELIAPSSGRNYLFMIVGGKNEKLFPSIRAYISGIVQDLRQMFGI